MLTLLKASCPHLSASSEEVKKAVATLMNDLETEEDLDVASNRLFEAFWIVPLIKGIVHICCIPSSERKSESCRNDGEIRDVRT